MKHIILLLIAVNWNYGQGHYFKKFNTIRRPVPLDVSGPLILTSLIEAGEIEQARSLSKVNYADFNNVDFYSGYLQVDKEFDNNLFFYFFPSEDNYKTDPVILWLQGGPGAPAGYGIFIENGPFIVNQDYSIKLREHRWTKNQSVLYIDNPVGTGFSFSNNQGYARNQTKVGHDLYNALIQFFSLFPEIQSNDFFVFGESYGGKYVPAVGYTILRNNPEASLKVNLKGLGIGNGLSDPVNQGNYGDYLYQLGLVDEETKVKLHEYWSLVKQYVGEENWSNATEYFDNNMNNLISTATGVVTEYNYLQMDPYEEEYWQGLIQDRLREALHIGNTHINNGPVFEYLYDDIAKSVAPWIEELLENYKILVYNGQLDIMVAYPMTVNYLLNLNFSSADEYKTAQRKFWRDTEGLAGYFKEAGNLTEVLVRNAGHMVPVDQPERAYRMMYNFVRGESLPQNNKYML